MDVHTPEQRRRNMAAIRCRDTKPELALRRLLWANGLRYRVHPRLPGRPDVAFVKAKLAVFVDGCFWHSCPDHCSMPASNTQFWTEKLARNVARDRSVDNQLAQLGWRVVRFWEHEIKDAPMSCVLKLESLLRI